MSVAVSCTGGRGSNASRGIAGECGVREGALSPERGVVHRWNASGRGRRTRATYRLLCVHATAWLRACACMDCVWAAAMESVVVVGEGMGSDAKVVGVLVGLVPAATRETASSATLESVPADPRVPDRREEPPRAPIASSQSLPPPLSPPSTPSQPELRRTARARQHAHRNSPHSAKSADTSSAHTVGTHRWPLLCMVFARAARA
jgi:hypothetical protein